MQNKSLILFIGVGFLVTIAIWGFVGGCGTPQKSFIEPQSEPVVPRSDTKPVVTAGNNSMYTVQNGDSLWKISKEYGVSIARIKEVNNLKSDAINTGQRLVIPDITGKTKKKAVKNKKIKTTKRTKPKEVKKKVAPAAKDLVVYKVRRGDSVWRIAQVHGVTIKRITELNGIPRNAKLIPGQELLVPKEK